MGKRGCDNLKTDLGFPKQGLAISRGTGKQCPKSYVARAAHMHCSRAHAVEETSDALIAYFRWYCIVPASSCEHGAPSTVGHCCVVLNNNQCCVVPDGWRLNTARWIRNTGPIYNSNRLDPRQRVARVHHSLYTGSVASKASARRPFSTTQSRAETFFDAARQQPKCARRLGNREQGGDAGEIVGRQAEAGAHTSSLENPRLEA